MLHRHILSDVQCRADTLDFEEGAMKFPFGMENCQLKKSDMLDWKGNICAFYSAVLQRTIQKTRKSDIQAEVWSLDHCNDIQSKTSIRLSELFKTDTEYNLLLPLFVTLL